MSARLLGIGFACCMGATIRKLVLLKLIDACQDDGSRIFPAVETIARAAECSTRQVQRELAEMVKVGLLAIVSEGGGRGRPREYALDVAMLQRIETEGWEAVAQADCAPQHDQKGDTVSPFGEAERVTPATERVTPATQKGDSWSHPTPYRPLIDPSQGARRAHAEPPGGGEREFAAGAKEGEGPKGDALDEGDAPEGGDSPESPEADDGVASPSRQRRLVEAAFKRFGPTWPSWVSDSEPAARKAWQGLDDAGREAAARLAPAYLAAEGRLGRTKHCSLATYLNERRWEKLDPVEPAASGEAQRLAPWGKAWMAWRLHLLASQPKRVWRPTVSQAAVMLDADFRKLLEPWPEADEAASKSAWQAFRTLSAGDRVSALERLDCWLAQQPLGRGIPAPDVYLRDRLFANVAADGSEASFPSARMFTAERRRAEHPDVALLDQSALNRVPKVLPPGEAVPEHAGYVQVKRGSAQWQAWAAWHEARDWPWIEPPGAVEWAWLPAEWPPKCQAERQDEAANGGRVDGHVDGHLGQREARR